MFKQGCQKTFGVGKKTCSDGVYTNITKILALALFTSGSILCISDGKKSRWYGGLLGIFGMIGYLLIINPLLIQNQDSKANQLAVLLNSDLMENFLMNIAVCGGFILVMANGINEIEEFNKRLTHNSNVRRNKPQNNGIGH